MNDVKRIDIRYFAVLREKAGKTREVVETLAATPSELYGELAQRYGFPADHNSIRVSVNDDFQSMDSVLNTGDSVIFIPPVAGG